MVDFPAIHDDNGNGEINTHFLAIVIHEASSGLCIAQVLACLLPKLVNSFLMVTLKHQYFKPFEAIIV